jgi:hypothetical protein
MNACIAITTLADLEARLERAKLDLECARRIDNWQRCQIETDAASARIVEIEKQIADLKSDDDGHVAAAALALGDRHAG